MNTMTGMGGDSLPSWREGATKRAIVDFIRTTTKEGHGGYVPPRDRVAVFDNDGTLWCEQPVPVQGLFALDRVSAMAERDPSLRSKELFRAILDHDEEAIAKFGKREIAELFFATHTGMTPDEFAVTAKRWLAKAKNPRLNRPVSRCVYRPMIELLTLLRAHSFSTFIVTGGGVEFVRAFAEDFYGVPSHHVVGSSGKTRVEERDGKLVLEKLPELETFDDGNVKARNIELHIGRRPIFAVGNSDGDLPMLRYAADGKGPRLSLLVHHDDQDREFAYDAEFNVSPLKRGLAEARERGWQIVSMKEDFGRVFA